MEHNLYSHKFIPYVEEIKLNMMCTILTFPHTSILQQYAYVPMYYFENNAVCIIEQKVIIIRTSVAEIFASISKRIIVLG